MSCLGNGRSWNGVNKYQNSTVSKKKQLKVVRLDEFCAARMHSAGGSQPSSFDFVAGPSHSSYTVRTSHEAEPAVNDFAAADISPHVNLDRIGI